MNYFCDTILQNCFKRKGLMLLIEGIATFGDMETRWNVDEPEKRMLAEGWMAESKAFGRCYAGEKMPHPDDVLKLFLTDDELAYMQKWNSDPRHLYDGKGGFVNPADENPDWSRAR